MLLQVSVLKRYSIRLRLVILGDAAVDDIITVSGFSLLGGAGSNNGLAIIMLKDWEERTTPELGLKQLIPRLMGQLWSMPDAQIMVFNPPPIPGLGNSSGFEFKLQDNEGRDPAATSTSDEWTYL